tara:strand:- start:7388 stop:8518 length:1131 start_codon:yes stop_codon:yes gene_type:complete
MKMQPRTYIGIWLTGFAAIILLLVVLSDILLPFVAGMAVAYFLDPVADRLQRHGLSRTLATAVITAAFIIVIGLILFFLLPVLQGQVVEFLKNLPDYFQAARGWAEPMIERWMSELEPERVDRAEAVIEKFSGRAVQFVLGILGDVWAGGMALVNFLALIFITPVVTFYMLRDWDDILSRIDKWIPRNKAVIIREQASLMDSALSGFVRGTGIVCLLLAIFYGATLSAVGLEFGLVIGICAGLLSFVPYLGSIGGLAICIAMAALQFDEAWIMGVVAAIFIFGQVASDYFLVPRLVGQRIRLHPVWIIFAVLAGGSLFGFVGMLISVPAAALIGVLVRFGVKNYLESEMYDNEQEKNLSGDLGNESLNTSEDGKNK